MARSLRVISLVVALLLISTGCATPLRESSWVVVQSKRFEIYSTLRTEEAKSLAKDLERFHALVYLVTNAPRVESAVPTRIFAFARRSEYSQVGPAGTAGAFSPGLRSNQIVLLDYSPNLGASEVILHEYVHFILRNGKNRPYPVWYDEGLAEFFSTVVPHGNVLVVGAMPKGFVQPFERGRWASTEQIIAARSYEDLPTNFRYMLYPQSWALVHYLALDRGPDAPSLTKGLARYLDLIESGTSTSDAYRAAFGEIAGRSGQKIKSLLDGGDMNVIGIPIAKIDYDRSEPSVRTPSPAEVAVRLGQLHLGKGDATKAEEEFLAALAIRAEDSRAHAGLGDALKFQENFADAEAHFERAVELDPKDPLNHLDRAEYYHDRALKKAETLEALRADLATARGHYHRALDLDADLPETLVMLGVTHLAPGEDPKLAGGFLEKAFDRVPSAPAILGHIAEFHLAQGDEASARLFLNRMLAVRGDDRRDNAIDKALDEIKKRRTEAAEKVGLTTTASNGR